MPFFTYKAKIKPNTFRSGTIEAESEKAAINKLLLLNYHPVSIKIKTEENQKKIFFSKKITKKEIYLFLRQLANLNSAGLSIVKSLLNITNQSSNSKLREIVAELREKLQKGSTLSEAMSFYPNVFSLFEVNMIKSAEAAGNLPEAISKIADIKEKEIDFANKVRSSLAYPILLLVVGITTLTILITFVLPKFIVLFDDLGQDLPIITKILINTSMFFKSYWLILLFCLGFFILILNKHLKTKSGMLFFDKIRIRVPLIKDINLRIQIGRFARMLGSLIANGVPIITSLKITSEISTNLIFSNEVKHIHAQVAKGQHISEALKDSTLFDKNTLDLIAVGEESGKLDEMLFRIAHINESESSRLIDTLMFMVEPALILFLGIVVGFIVMAILLPIFHMNFLV